MDRRQKALLKRVLAVFVPLVVLLVLSIAGTDFYFAYRILHPQKEAVINTPQGYEQVLQKPIWDEKTGVLIAAGGDMSGGTMLAIWAGGRDDVTNARRAWRQTRMKGSIGTGVVHERHVYSIASDGFLLCIDAKTGNRLWQKRLESTGGKGSSWSSILLADGKLYIPNQSGDVFVVRAAPKFELLETNSVDEPTNASLAASNGELFLRTDKALWCVGEKK